jgi:Holliday junction resolvase RusA-like endonuclease
MNSELEVRKLLRDNPHLKLRSDTGSKAETQPEERETGKAKRSRVNQIPLPEPEITDNGWMVLPYPVAVNQMYRVAGKRLVLSDDGKKFKENIAGYFMKYKPKMLTGDVSVHVTMYRPWKRGDIDGILKALLDCMEGVCYKNDNQIIELVVKRRDDKLNPRVNVYVMEA